MPQEVGCAVLKGRHLAPLFVAAGGVDEYQVEKSVLLAQPLHAVAAMNVDIVQSQSLCVALGQFAKLRVLFYIVHFNLHLLFCAPSRQGKGVNSHTACKVGNVEWLRTGCF